jgi:hypothetical protein
LKFAIEALVVELVIRIQYQFLCRKINDLRLEALLAEESCRDVTTNVDIVTANVASSQLQRQSDVWASFSALANRSSLATAAALGGRRSPAVEELQFHMKVCEDRGESPGNALDVDLTSSEERGEVEEDRGSREEGSRRGVVCRA